MERPMSGKARPSIDGSFSRLADLVNKAGLRLKSRDESLISRNGTQEAMPLNPDVSRPPHELSDEELFRDAMRDVERVSWRRQPHPSSRPAQFPNEGDPHLEALKLMQEAVDGDFPAAILDHPEYIEGWIDVAGKRFLPKLRNGLYSIQGQIDLHGLSRVEAEHAVEEYIIRMSRFRSCCIKIIHGRGINSQTDRATLKESLQRLLSTRRMSRYVVAYSSAPYKDGGVGAVYVLLQSQHSQK